MTERSLFDYICPSCGHSGALSLEPKLAVCSHCAEQIPVYDGDILMFFSGKSEQTDRFDKVYSSGQMNELDSAADDGVFPIEKDAIEHHKRIEESMLEHAGIDVSTGFHDLDVLEVACGTGWLTAGLMQTETVKNCRFHAFDISPVGLTKLSRYVQALDTTNRLELSVQDANSMSLASESIDVIFSYSTLHHFDEYERHLRDVYRVLRPGGVALYAEPLALGHALTAAAAKIATSKFEKPVREIEAYYANIKFRIRNAKSKSALAPMVDKHVFFVNEVRDLAREIGFSRSKLCVSQSYDFLADEWVEMKLREWHVDDDDTISAAKAVYSVIAETFGAEAYVNALPTFDTFYFKK